MNIVFTREITTLFWVLCGALVVWAVFYMAVSRDRIRIPKHWAINLLLGLPFIALPILMAIFSPITENGRNMEAFKSQLSSEYEDIKSVSWWKACELVGADVDWFFNTCKEAAEIMYLQPSERPSTEVLVGETTYTAGGIDIPIELRWTGKEFVVVGK